MRNLNSDIRTFHTFLYVCLIPLLILQCRSSNKNDTMQKTPIKEVIKQHSTEIMSIPGVVGLYQGETDDGKPCIKVMLEKESNEIEQKIPKKLDGYPVIIDVTGKIKPMNQDTNNL
jgi:hypothetical protein